jgi:hypothetical protein
VAPNLHFAVGMIRRLRRRADGLLEIRALGFGDLLLSRELVLLAALLLGWGACTFFLVSVILASPWLCFAAGLLLVPGMAAIAAARAAAAMPQRAAEPAPRPRPQLRLV